MCKFYAESNVRLNGCCSKISHLSPHIQNHAFRTRGGESEGSDLYLNNVLKTLQLVEFLHHGNTEIRQIGTDIPQHE